MNDNPGDQRPRRAWRSPMAWAVLIAVFAIGATVDLWLKHWTFENVASQPVDLSPEVILDEGTFIPYHDPVVVIPRLLNLHLVKNEGAVFGIGANQRVFFIVFTMAALTAAVAVFARWTTEGSWSAHVAIGDSPWAASRAR